MKCLLDMDGVADDFVGALCKAHGLQSPYLNKEEKRWNFFECWGMNEKDAYAPINEQFWSSVNKTPWCDWLIETVRYLFGPENIYFLSKPIKGTGAYEGKGKWLELNTPYNINQLFLGREKHAVAHAGCVLVDDSDPNVNAFKEEGGNAILCPAPWNSLSHIYHSGVDAVKTYLLEQLIKLKD